MRRRWPLLIIPVVLIGATFAAARPADHPLDDLYAALPELREVAAVDTPELTASLRTGPMPLAEARARMDRLARTKPLWTKQPTPGQYNFTPNPPPWARVSFLAQFDHRRTVLVLLDAGVPVDMDRPSDYRTPEAPYATLRVHSWRLGRTSPIGDLIHVGHWTAMAPGRDR